MLLCCLVSSVISQQVSPISCSFWGWSVQELMQRIIRREQLAVRYAGPFGGASQAWDGSDVVVLLAGGIAVSLSPFHLRLASRACTRFLLVPFDYKAHHQVQRLVLPAVSASVAPGLFLRLSHASFIP